MRTARACGIVAPNCFQGGYRMDLGISGKRAIVCASSKGLGLGCARALAEAGVDLVMNARGAEALEKAAAANYLRRAFRTP